MFSNKPAKPIPAARAENAEAAPPRKSFAASLIAENVALRGDLTTEGDIHLDGALVGDIRVGCLVIGETGQVEGSIEADAVEIRGRVTGTISARSVKLYATARVDGDITQDQLSIEAGADFAGRSLKRAAPAQEQLSLVAAAE
jgi:cytoskeletal protein CcmA (bactofilin family)